MEAEDVKFVRDSALFVATLVLLVKFVLPLWMVM